MPSLGSSRMRRTRAKLFLSCGTASVTLNLTPMQRETHLAKLRELKKKQMTGIVRAAAVMRKRADSARESIPSMSEVEASTYPLERLLTSQRPWPEGVDPA